MDMDQLGAKVGGMSRYQWAIVFAVTLFSWTEFMDQTSVFFSAIPKHRCQKPTPENDTTPSGEGAQKSIHPFKDETQCDTIHLNSTNYFNDTTSSKCLAACDHGYEYDTSAYQTSTISEWNLVCDRRILDAMAISLYYAGIGVGAPLVGILTDRLGRKRCMLLFAINIVSFGILSSYAKEFASYVFFRFLVGMSDSIYFTTFIYVSEISDSKRRRFAESYMVIFSGASHVVLPGVAYAVREWRTLGRVASLIPAVYFVIFPFIPESPRWLLSVGKCHEARSFYEKCADSNGKKLLEQEWNEVVEFERKKAAETTKHPISVIFRWRYMRAITLNVMFCFFAMNLVFEGLVVNITALADLAKASTGFAIAGKFFASMSFIMLIVLTNELYPTAVKGSGMSAGSLASRIGPVLMPFVLLLQVKVTWLTQVIFGVISLAASGTSLFFPDTSTAPMLVGIEEAEEYYAQNMHLMNKIFGQESRLGGKNKGKLPTPPSGGTSLENEIGIKANALMPESYVTL